MNARVLCFPLAVAGIAALDGCGGIDINSPMVKVCKDEQYEILMQFSNGRVTHDTMTVHADTTRCRKAA